MRKLFLMLTVLCSVILCSCNKGIDVQSAINSDLAELTGNFPDNKIVFYESQMTLNNEPVNCTTLCPPYVTETANIFQVWNDSLNTTVYIYHHDGKDVSMEEIPGAFWVGDAPATVPAVTQKDAVTMMMKTVEAVPNSKLVTYRKPLGSHPFENACYIYGGTKEGNFVFVDGTTCEVVWIENLKAILESYATEIPDSTIVEDACIEIK